VVQIRVTPKTRNPFTITSLSISGVTWEWHFLNRAQMDTTTPHGELLFGIFGSLAQYERALTRERVLAGLAAAKRRGRKGGRPPAIDPERVEQIVATLETGASKASVCRSFKVPRSTLLDTLARIGWIGPTSTIAKPHDRAPARGRKGASSKVA